VTAYFLMDTPDGPRLTREARRSSGDPLEAALKEFLIGPADPDSTSPWNSGTDVLGVERRGDEIVVNLSTDAGETAGVDANLAEVMAQQLVYTVTAAAGDPEASVLLLIDGGPARDLWGGALDWTAPMHRQPPAAVLAPIQIDAPLPGAYVTGDEIEVSGEAASLDDLTWSLRHRAGGVVASGTLPNTASDEGFVPFALKIPAGPGRYTLEIWATTPTSEGTQRLVDTRSFSVHLSA